MIETTHSSFGEYMHIALDSATQCGSRAQKSSLRSKIIKTVLGSNFKSLHNATLKQRHQLHDVIRKVISCVKHIKQCDNIKGLILPSDGIKSLLSHYNSNLQKLHCYERRVTRWQNRYKTATFWSIAILLVDCFINFIVGIIHLVRYGTALIIHDFSFTQRDRIITTDHFRNVSWVAEENVTTSHDVFEITKPYTHFVYDNVYVTALALLIALGILSSLICVASMILWIVGTLNIDDIFDNITIAEAEQGYMIYKQFFDALQVATAEKLPYTTSSARADKKVVQELFGQLQAEKYSVYTKDLFKNDTAVRRLFIRVKLWIDQVDR